MHFFFSCVTFTDGKGSYDGKYSTPYNNPKGRFRWGQLNESQSTKSQVEFPLLWCPVFWSHWTSCRVLSLWSLCNVQRSNLAPKREIESKRNVPCHYHVIYLVGGYSFLTSFGSRNFSCLSLVLIFRRANFRFNSKETYSLTGLFLHTPVKTTITSLFFNIINFTVPSLDCSYYCSQWKSMFTSCVH